MPPSPPFPHLWGPLGVPLSPWGAALALLCPPSKRLEVLSVLGLGLAQG
jgi:hypothetical protein